ncbi:MAG: acetate/propionate family kinase [Pseudomonadota bacterium]
MRAVLTLNAGSSSLKFALFSVEDEPQVLASGLVERIGGADARVRARSATGESTGDETAAIPSHADALERALALLTRAVPEAEVKAVGHRVVHGGPDFEAPLRLDDASLAQLAALEPFAPLHQPHNLAGIRAAASHFPEAAQVGCFDTAFHRTQSREADSFALPRAYYDKGVRRYGFHGLSYDYLAGHLARKAPLLFAGRVIVAHLGNGASMCAMIDGHSVGSTMGFSALDGLPMGTRSGQIDPGVLLYLMEQEGMGAAEISDLLYKRSGLLGMSGVSNDMRALEASTAPEAREAITYFTTRIRREIGALTATMGGLDALVFTGGIGENSVRVRDEATDRMGWLGIEIDPMANSRSDMLISTPLSRVAVMVIPTNEELVIARAAAHHA